MKHYNKTTLPATVQSAADRLRRARWAQYRYEVWADALDGLTADQEGYAHRLFRWLLVRDDRPSASAGLPRDDDTWRIALGATSKRVAIRVRNELVAADILQSDGGVRWRFPLAELALAERARYLARQQENARGRGHRDETVSLKFGRNISKTSAIFPQNADEKAKENNGSVEAVVEPMAEPDAHNNSIDRKVFKEAPREGRSALLTALEDRERRRRSP